ncbi:MAG: glycosyltransferase family 4 protein [Pyrinomonadaceae bacterium]
MASPALDISPTDSVLSAPGRLHVVHLIEALGPGGAERLLHTNLKHFDRSRVRSTVFTVYPHATHWREPIEELGVEVVSLNCESPRQLAAAIRKFRAWLRANRPDLIHSHLWAANVIARVAGRLAGIPVISSIHNPDHEPEAWADGATVSKRKRLTAKTIDRWTARFGNQRLIAVSDYVKQSAHRHLKFALNDIDLVYNPIDLDLLSQPPTKSRDEILRESGLPADALMLLNVARVSPQKGLIYAVRAMPRILEQFPNAHLVSVGSTTDPLWLEELTRETQSMGVAQHVHILGARRDVQDFLAACDLFIFPSLYEGLGIALIEAMAAGCLCVATNTGPIPEFLRHGHDGILVPPKDLEALATAVCELLSNPEGSEQISINARRTALERFQPQAAANRLTEIYEKLAKTRR